ncbi:glycoside hydrolase family 13 protein [Anaerotignum lactatifermentans]|uniref:Glycoside hydrolase family 13 protein n=1 Tax=Anaerotignum lactatifermentans TaxID=160404 RepID=A0ABS2GAX2_9FIRM|nr:glycoside hydrolase family 13 protein [Anaerotignum lactatifermentans]MBM6828374.1 glycoside hydrolase family 13 protein [Anaerotignum lactatifermentans]MBM6877654.1 glycoside hydrolase family 13 protein [Anaerotignum lactatifermentans]MBM6949957.1 glycoside hydrolase family 13 protein [Anaerotignum lactatifermentans]
MSYVDLINKKKVVYDPVFRKEAVFSDETPRYRRPAEPSAEDFVEVRLRVGANQAAAAYLCMNDKKYLMEKIFTEGMFAYYRVLLPPTAEQMWYFFSIQHMEKEYFYSRYGVTEEEPRDGLFSIVRDFHTPQWAKGAVMYQIYVDRFCNGDPTNDVVSGEYRYLGKIVRRIEKWDTKPENEDFRNFYGGDLRGVMDKLGYLASLGVEVIYLNPIFVSPSSHKYDTQDYSHVDPHFGVILKDESKLLHGNEKNSRAEKYIARTTDPKNLKASDALFAELVQKAHAHGIRVILDGVFNHCGAFHKWLDREKIYFHDKEGAFYCRKSPYHDFFYWNPDGTYEGWWGYENHPKLNYENTRLREMVMEIGKKWVSPPYCADGWRLDVAADLGKSEEFNHQFWKEFRNVVKTANPEAVILAEHYGDAARWLEGDQWDSIMNYDAFMEPVTWFFTGVNKHSTEYRGDLLNNADYFWGTMDYQMGKIPVQARETAMNELSNHDHSRFLTRTNGKTGRLHTETGHTMEEGIQMPVMREAVLVQMTWPGAPTIYYGDEAGLTGWTDPDNRRTFPWGREDQELTDYHRALISLRKENPVLREGSLKKLLSQQGILAYGRFDEESRMAVLCNNLETEVYLEVELWQMEVSLFTGMRVLMETDERGYRLPEDKILTVENGILRLTMPPRSGLLLKEVKE